ncbi:MAG: type II toxin-antitoxin system prevent-host-death family antitoxin [Qipengyuania sp.]|nr:type II toxin-antitoxin system prevent-host-death family antitoxin [Qipengyuania sp.]
MDRLITATEANQRFSEVLRDVSGGDSFTVTSRGRPVARVTPVTANVEERRRRLDELLEFLGQQPPIKIKPWKREDLYD